MKLEISTLRLTSLLMLGFILFMYSCSNDDNDPVSPAPTTNTVTGKVINEIGNGIPNTTVFITGTNEPTTTGADGSFAISGVTAPYDLIMVSGNFGFQYKGLSTFTPQLLAIGPASTSNSATLTVVIPAMTAGQQCRAYFTDGVNVQSVSAPIVFPAVTKTFSVSWPSGASITGKIIVLIYTVSGTIISHYDKYGEIANYTINNGGVQTQTFTSSDITVVPGNAIVTGSISSPANYNVSGSALLIKFGNAGSPLSGSGLYQIAGNTYSYNVPTGLTTAPVISVEGVGTGPNNIQTFKAGTVTVPSTGNVIILESAATLSSPPNGETNINFNTNFTFSSGSGTGLNVVSFTGQGKSFYVFTTASNVKLPDLSNLGLGISASTVYNWNLIKICTFSGIDQFVSSGIYFNPGYVSESFSETRSFTTAP